MTIRAFAGDDYDTPLPPGGIRYGTYTPTSYMSDYRPEMDWQSAPLVKPAFGGWLDDLLGDASTTAADTVSGALVAQVPAIVAATTSSPAYRAEIAKLRAEAMVGGILLGMMVVGGVYVVLKK